MNKSNILFTFLLIFVNISFGFTIREFNKEIFELLVILTNSVQGVSRFFDLNLSNFLRQNHLKSQTYKNRALILLESFLLLLTVAFFLLLYFDDFPIDWLVYGVVLMISNRLLPFYTLKLEFLGKVQNNVIYVRLVQLAQYFCIGGTYVFGILNGEVMISILIVFLILSLLPLIRCLCMNLEILNLQLFADAFTFNFLKEIIGISYLFVVSKFIVFNLPVLQINELTALWAEDSILLVFFLLSNALNFVTLLASFSGQIFIRERSNFINFVRKRFMTVVYFSCLFIFISFFFINNILLFVMIVLFFFTFVELFKNVIIEVNGLYFYYQSYLLFASILLVFVILPSFLHFNLIVSSSFCLVILFIYFIIVLFKLNTIIKNLSLKSLHT